MKNLLVYIFIMTCLPNIYYAQTLVAKNALDFNVKIDENEQIHFTWTNVKIDSIMYLQTDSNLNKLFNPITISNSKAARTPDIYVSAESIDIVWRETNIQNSLIKGASAKRSDNSFSKFIYYNEDLVSNFERFDPQIDKINDTTLLTVWYGYGKPATSHSMNIYAQTSNLKQELIGDNYLVNIHDQLNFNTSSRNPKILPLDYNNEYFVFWIDDNNGKENIYAQKFADNGTVIDSIISINQPNPDTEVFNYEVIKCDNGYFAVVWSAKILISLEINICWFNDNGLQLGPKTKVNDGSYSVNPYSIVSVAENKNDEVIVCWEGNIEGKVNLVAQKISYEKSAIGTNFNIVSTNQNTEQFFPKLISRDSLFYCFWRDVDLNIYSIIFGFNDHISTVNDNKKIRHKEQFTLTSAYPNPFNSGINITFSVIEKGVIRLAVYDLLGREIIDLIDRQALSKGKYEIFWDGKSRTGNYLPSGTYLLRYSHNLNNYTQKVVLLK